MTFPALLRIDLTNLRVTPGGYYLRALGMADGGTCPHLVLGVALHFIRSRSPTPAVISFCDAVEVKARFRPEFIKDKRGAVAYTPLFCSISEL